jgi:DNA repair photolyase
MKDIIYEPKGKAKEYADLACEIYNSCTHGCIYCYAKYYTKDVFYKTATPRKNFIARLKEDVKLLGADCPEILLSFHGDVYQPAEDELRLTRAALEILRKSNLAFTVLTKAGTRAVRDFDILEGYDKARFGTTLIFTDQADADYWEPAAASVEDRISAIKTAHEKGIRTWVSIEPVIDSVQAIQLVKRLHPFVDHWKVGKINYHKEIEDAVDWIRFRKEITDLFGEIGADYYLKKSLTDL